MTGQLFPGDLIVIDDLSREDFPIISQTESMQGISLSCYEHIRKPY